jgi:membrane peptidoglycan carboxypeptidase
MIVVNDDDIPELFKQAFIAAEDSTFYDHVGIDVRRIVGSPS